MWRNLLQVLARKLNHLKQQHRHLNCVALACRCNLSLFSGEQERTEVGSKAPPAVAKSSPKAAKLGCAFSHSAERIVDELGLLCGAFSSELNHLARNTKIVFSPQRGGFSWALCLYDYFTDSICLRDGRST